MSWPGAQTSGFAPTTDEGDSRGNTTALSRSLLTTSRGKSFDPIYYGARFADALYEAKLPDVCVLHGLRKCAARKLAEARCSEQEIMSVTGHRTSAMVAHWL